MVRTREQAQAAREAKLDELHERLTGAVEQLVSGDDWRRALTFAARFRARSFSNTLLIWAQHGARSEERRVGKECRARRSGERQRKQGWERGGRDVVTWRRQRT